MKPFVKSCGAAVELINWQVLSTWQELFNLAKSDGPKILVNVMTFEITFSQFLTLDEKALKKVLNWV